MSDKIVIPPQFTALLPFLLGVVPVEAHIGGRVVRLRDTLSAALADGDLDAEDALTFAAAFLAAPTAPPPELPPSVKPVLPPADDDEPPAMRMVWPDAVTLELKWALEPGLDSDGQQALVSASCHEENGVIVFDAHPEVVNDRTKITLEAGLEFRGKGLHYSEHPHLTGSVQFVALVDGVQVGVIGGKGGLVDLKRDEDGVGWGGDLYVRTGGSQGVASIKERLKGRTVELQARCPLSPYGPVSRSLFTRVVV